MIGILIILAILATIAAGAALMDYWRTDSKQYLFLTRCFAFTLLVLIAILTYIYFNPQPTNP